MSDLEKIRSHLYLPAYDSVEIRIQHTPTGEPVAFFQCRSCEDLVMWVSERNRLECQTCGYEMTRDESADLCDWTVHQITALSSRPVKKKKRGFLWRLFRWLGIVGPEPTGL